jgi:hypothetical protein
MSAIGDFQPQGIAHAYVGMICIDELQPIELIVCGQVYIMDRLDHPHPPV